MAWYLTALDFETGETVFKVFTGTGIVWNNSWAPITIGPNGTAYVGVYNGLIALRDGEEQEPPRTLECSPSLPAEREFVVRGWSLVVYSSVVFETQPKRSAMINRACSYA